MTLGDTAALALIIFLVVRSIHGCLVAEFTKDYAMKVGAHYLGTGKEHIFFHEYKKKRDRPGASRAKGAVDGSGDSALRQQAHQEGGERYVRKSKL